MSGLSWFKRRGPCRIETRSMGDWRILEVHGKFVAGHPEKKFLDEVNSILKDGARRVVVDLSESLLADDAVASAASLAFHKAKVAGVDLRFVVLPGKQGGYYHMAGLEMHIPTYSTLSEALA